MGKGKTGATTKGVVTRAKATSRNARKLFERDVGSRTARRTVKRTARSTRAGTSVSVRTGADVGRAAEKVGRA